MEIVKLHSSTAKDTPRSKFVWFKVQTVVKKMRKYEYDLVNKN